MGIRLGTFVLILQHITDDISQKSCFCDISQFCDICDIWQMDIFVRTVVVMAARVSTPALRPTEVVIQNSALHN
mgnify:CR=1 FL=1